METDQTSGNQKAPDALTTGAFGSSSKEVEAKSFRRDKGATFGSPSALPGIQFSWLNYEPLNKKVKTRLQQAVSLRAPQYD